MTKEEKSVVKSTSEVPKSRGSRDRHQKKDKPKPLTKVIIRRLPPTMTEEEFLKQIDPLPEHDFYYYAAADWSLGFDATCRAYITFRNHEDVFLFRDRFDGYVFVDTKGEEYQAVVEFAPFQGLPKNKARKTDPKVNTIESEPHYINFLQKLEEDREASKNECKLEFSLQPKDEKKITSTPLLQYLMNKRLERREEQKKRYEDNRRKREEEKQKRRIRLAKNIPPAVKEESIQPKEDKKKTDVHGDIPEEKKNSKSKRRAERDQRRREEYEQRRREREKERAAAAASGEGEPKAIATPEQAPGKDPEKTQVLAKPPDADGKRKEVKKYSERRERNRSKNWPNTILATDSATTSATTTTTPAETSNSPGKSEFVSTTFAGLSFVKEFVPKHKQKAAPKDEEDTSVNMEEVNEKLENISLQEKKENTSSTDKDREEGSAGKKSKRAERSQRNSSSSGGHGNEAKSEERSERRIRNKDRPSIVIYQPGKTRLRSSEEGPLTGEPRSNPPSDTESLKKEERPTTARKVSRYSERRSGRARDARQKSFDDGKTIKAASESIDVAKEEKVEKPAEESNPTEKVNEELD